MTVSSSNPGPFKPGQPGTQGNPLVKQPKPTSPPVFGYNPGKPEQPGLPTRKSFPPTRGNTGPFKPGQKTTGVHLDAIKRRMRKANNG